MPFSNRIHAARFTFYQQQQKLNKKCRSLLKVLIAQKGLMQVRHFGFLANCCRRKKLDVIRRQLPDIIEQKDNEKTNSPNTCWPYPNCKIGVLMLMSIALPSINVQRISSG
jgi:hypothetical protein